MSGFFLQAFLQTHCRSVCAGDFSGAKLVVSLVSDPFAWQGDIHQFQGMILAAFAGAMISMGFVLLISGQVKKMSMLVICGVMISYICSAVTDFIITFADEANIVNLHNWSMGSFFRDVLGQCPGDGGRDCGVAPPGVLDGKTDWRISDGRGTPRTWA